ncbi:MAG: hypothetical protein ACJ789_08700 [Thermomicrobiales bacterium]
MRRERYRIFGKGPGVAVRFLAVASLFAAIAGLILAREAFFSAAAATNLSITAGADAEVRLANPNSNSGTASSLMDTLGTTTASEAYLRFNVSGITGPIQKAVLRLNATKGTANGPVVYAAANASTPTITPTPTLPPLAGESLTLPIRAAFYYAWFPESWKESGFNPFTNYNPSLGFYDSSAPALIANHIAAMQYGGIQAGIASWWGIGKSTDTRMPALLAGAAGTGFKWGIYYEEEARGTPTIQKITSDLMYIRNNYANDPSYLRVNGKFVVFVYLDASDNCTTVDRWKQANTVGAYIDLMIFPGFRTCESQPDQWHNYAPAVADDRRTGYSYGISPGFWKKGEANPRRPRNIASWNQSVQAMIKSGEPWQLVLTFNEWGEGTAVESATEWESLSGYGYFLDALHSNGNGPIPSTTATTAPNSTPTNTPVPPTATPTNTAVPPTPTSTPIPRTPAPTNTPLPAVPTETSGA